MPLPPLLADGGDMTIVRPVASHGFGRYSITYPDGVEPPAGDPDVEQGYLYRLREEPPPFGRGFIRADLEINAELGTSTVEEVLDEAANRTAGETLFQRDIPRSGLGRLVPGVDFEVGDLMPVRLWGRILPNQLVTAIDDVSEPGAEIDYRTHIGGQLIRDNAGRIARNRENQRAIEQERRERMAGDQAIGAVASEAKGTAETAKSTAETAETTAGEARSTAETALSAATDADGVIESKVAEARGLIEEGRESAQQVAGHVKAAEQSATDAHTYAQEAMRFADQADQILAGVGGDVEAARAALAEVRGLHEQVQANILLAQQAVTDSQAHVEEADRLVGVASGHAGDALAYAREAGVLVDEAEQLNAKMQALNSQMTQMMLAGRRYVAAASGQAALAVERAGESQRLVDEARVILSETAAHQAAGEQAVEDAQAQVEQARQHATDAGTALSGAQASEAASQQARDDARQALTDTQAAESRAETAMTGAETALSQAQGVLGETRTARDQSVTAAGEAAASLSGAEEAMSGAQSALSESRSSLSALQGLIGGDVPTDQGTILSLYADILVQHQDIFDWHAEVLTAHGETLEAQGKTLAAQQDVDAKHGQVLVQHQDVLTWHGEVLTAHGDVLVQHGEILVLHQEALDAQADTIAVHTSVLVHQQDAIDAATAAAGSASDAAGKALAVTEVHTQVLTLHGDAINAAAQAAEQAGYAAADAGAAADSALDAVEVQQKINETQKQINDLYARAIRAAAASGAQAGAAAMQAAMAADQANQAAQSALDAAATNTDSIALLKEADTKLQEAIGHNTDAVEKLRDANIKMDEAIRAAAAAAESAGEAGRQAGVAAGEAGDAADSALEATAVLSDAVDAATEAGEARDAAQDIANSQQDDALKLHDNQLKWMRWTTAQDFFVEGEVENEFFYAATAGSPTQRVDFVKRGTWAGEMTIQHRNHAGQVQWAQVTIPPAGYDKQFFQGFDANVSALHNAIISINPLWGNAPREFLVRAREIKDQGFHYTDSYINPREGNPITFGADESIALIVPVIADQDVEVRDVMDEWHVVPSGETIHIGTSMRPSDSAVGQLVKFTQVLPEVDWGGEAPLTGVENFDLASRLLSYNTHTTLKRWVAPNWLSPRTVTFTYVARMRTTQALATYEASVWVNGTREHWTRVENDLFPKTTYRIERTRTNVQPGETFDFRMFAGSGDVDDRYVSGGSVSIEWS